MEDFRDDNFNTQEENTNPTEANGKISGFDEASFVDNTEQGSDSGFYSHTKENIIQDDITDKNPDFDTSKEEYSYTPNDSWKASQSTTPPIYNQPIKKEKKRFSAWTVVIAVCLAAVIGIVGSVGVMLFMNLDDKIDEDDLPSISQDDDKKLDDNNSDNGTTDVPSIPNTDSAVNTTAALGSVAQAVAEKCSGSVVGIRTTTSVSSFFGGSSESTGEGSGVLYTEQGHIITNYHVIKDALLSSRSKIEVFFDDCNTEPRDAEVIGYNISTDLAVLKIQPNGRKPLELGNSDKISRGQFVITIGAPGGLEFMGSVTYGIISGLNRVVSSDSNIGLIQTDAAINPGNSGGALLDSEGRLIGINSSKIVSEDFEGMGFAIPINKVVEVCNNIIQNRDSGEAYTGITISEKYTAKILKEYGYPSGAVVSSVAQGSPAEENGIRRGDIITEFNGVKITEFNVYYEALAKCKPGQTVEMKIYRGGKNYRTNIKIVSNMVS